MGKIYRCLIIIIVLLGFEKKIFAQTTVSYTGMGTIVCPASPTATISPSVTGLTFSQIVRGSGVTCVSANNGINGSGFTSASSAIALASNIYYAFSITADASTSFTVSQLQIYSLVSNVNGISCDILYNINGGLNASIGSFTPTATSTPYTITPGSAISVGIAETINFFIVPFGGSLAGTTCRIINSSSVTVTSSVIPTTFTSTQTGLWSDGSTWVGGVVPTNGSNVNIETGDNVTVDISVLPNSISVNFGGTLTINTNGQIGNSSNAVQSITIDGNFNIPATTGSLTPWLKVNNLLISNGGIFTNSTTSMNSTNIAITNFTVNANGTYNHDAISSSPNGSTADFPGTLSRSLASSSMINITKWAQTLNTPLQALPSIVYGHLSINIIGQVYTGSWNQAGAITSLNSLSIQGSGGYEFRLFGNSSGGTLNITNDIIVSGGKLAIINSTSMGAASAIVNVTGNVTVSGAGVLDLTGSGSATSGTSSLNIAGNLTVSGTGKLLRTQVVNSAITFNKSSGTQTINSIVDGINTNDILFNIGTGSSTNTLQMNSDFAMSAGGTLSVLSGATLDCGTYVVSGGSINVNSGSTIRTSNANGFASANSSGSVQTNTRTYNSAATYVFNGTTNQSTGDFFVGATTPNSVSTIEIVNTGTSPNNVVTLLLSGATATTLRLTAGIFSSGAGNVLNIGTNGFVTNNGGNIDSSSTGGTISFVGAGTVNGTTATTFRNVNVNAGAVNIPIGATIPLIAGYLQINGGNLTNPPKYGSASTLIYNTSYSRYVEWNYVGTGTIATSEGYPNNVTIAAGTFDVYNNATGEARACNGTLTINNTAVLNCNNMNSTLTVGTDLVIADACSFNMNTMSAALIVNDNISISGTLSLSTDFNGSLYLGGNWTRNSTGTFIPNSRSVFFIGSADQTITLTGGGIESFPYFCIDKQNTGTYVKPANTVGNLTDLYINGTSGNVLQLLDIGALDLNGRTCTIGNNNAGSIQISGGSRSIVSLSGPGLFIINGGPVATPMVYSSDGISSLSFSSSVRVELNNGFNFGNKLTTIAGTLRMNANSFVSLNAPYYSIGSLLQYYTGGNFNRTIEWGATSDDGYPYNVSISNNSTLIPGGSSNTGIALNLENDLTIDNGSSFYMDYGAVDMTVPLKVGNDININGNLSLSEIFGGDIEVGGNWTRNGVTGNFYPKDRAVFLNGSGLQTLTVAGGSTTETFDYLIIDNGAGVSLSSTDIHVDDLLTLSEGIITTGINEVYVMNDAGNAITGYQTDPASASYLNSSYINGNLRRDVAAGNNYVFPVGTATSYQYDSVSLTTFSGASSILCYYTAGNFSGATQCSDPATQSPAVTVLGTPITNLLLGGYWTMTPNATPSAALYDITLQEAAPFLGVATDDSSYAIIKRPDCTSDWIDEGFHDDATQQSYPNVTTPDVVKAFRSAVTSFSDFGIGYNSFFLLPVELTNFTVSLTNGISVLEWSTASEYNSHYFSIESSEDAIHFNEIGRMNAAGFSTVAQYYSFNDVHAGTSGATRIYYRLRMVDTDQTYQYSAVRWVDLEVPGIDEVMTIYPNPVQDVATIMLHVLHDQPAVQRMFDIAGKLIDERQFALNKGINFIELGNAGLLPSGIYIIQITSGSKFYTASLVKE